MTPPRFDQEFTTAQLNGRPVPVRQAHRRWTAQDTPAARPEHEPTALTALAPVALSLQDLVQSADLIAYTGFRALIPPGPNVAAACSQDMWDELGPAIHTPVTSVKPRCKPGVVVR